MGNPVHIVGDTRHLLANLGLVDRHGRGGAPLTNPEHGADPNAPLCPEGTRRAGGTHDARRP